MRVATIAWLPALIALLPAAALAGDPPPPPPACPPDGRILPPHAGEVVTAFFQVPDKPWPADWAVDSAGIAPGSVTVTWKGPGGAVARVRLLAPGAPEGREAGRWFALDAPADPPWLLGAARALDARFPASPWIPCAAGATEGVPDHQDRSLRRTLPTNGALAAALAQIGILLAAAGVALRGGRP